MSTYDVKRIIRDSFEGAGLPAPFVRLLEIPLRQPGRALSENGASQWENLILRCSEASSGNPEAVPVISAAFELCISALDVLDEIEDGDVSPIVSSVGIPRAMNVATTLLAQSQLVLSNLDTIGGLAGPPSGFVRLLNRAVVAATVGQDADLRSAGDNEVQLEHALDISRQKSGSLVAGAATLGALTGTSDEPVLDRYWEFGVHFGTMAQIANDIHDANAGSEKADAATGKPTLPRLFAARTTRTTVSNISDEQVEQAGGLHFSWVVFEIERRKCLRKLEELENAGQDTGQLKAMVKA